MKEFVLSSNELLDLIYSAGSAELKEKMRSLNEDQNLKALEVMGYPTLESKVREIAEGIENETLH